MKYRKRPCIVDAAQFTKEMAEGKEPLPPGIVLLNGRNQVLCVNGWAVIPVGHWVVTYEHSEERDTFPDWEFRAMYEPVEEVAPC